MHVLTSTDMLSLWERGQGLPPLEKARMLLEWVCPDEPPGALDALSVGACKARLLESCACTFGPVLDCEAACPACGEKLEFTVSIPDLLDGAARAPDTIAVSHGAATVTFRLPTQGDLLEMARQPQADARALLAWCALSGDTSALLETVATEAEARMAEADPLALTVLDLACPVCLHAWRTALDVAGFFFDRLGGEALRLLAEVDRLARAYGWHEADVLALSPWRRRQYLNLVEA